LTKISEEVVKSYEDAFEDLYFEDDANTKERC